MTSPPAPAVPNPLPLAGQLAGQPTNAHQCPPDLA